MKKRQIASGSQRPEDLGLRENWEWMGRETGPQESANLGVRENIGMGKTFWKPRQGEEQGCKTQKEEEG